MPLDGKTAAADVERALTVLRFHEHVRVLPIIRAGLADPFCDDVQKTAMWDAYCDLTRPIPND